MAEENPSTPKQDPPARPAPPPYRPKQEWIGNAERSQDPPQEERQR
jgi:hypothetical protein